MSISKQLYGKMPDGTAVDLYTLGNSSGMRVKLITYGATIVSVEAPDRGGKSGEITLHFDSLEQYRAGRAYFGATIGRYADQIAKGRFQLDGKEYLLATNNGPNHLHGGRVGFDKRVWRAEAIESGDAAGVKFTYTSADGEEGYPGNLVATAVYTLTADNQLKMEYTATTDRPTLANMTNHTYWNLSGSGLALGHELTLLAHRYLPADENQVPLGEFRPVEGTPMDFRQPHAIGARIDQVPGGYDHCYVIDRKPGETLSLAARVVEPTSGRVMEVYTDQPGLQFYSGNFLPDQQKPGGGTYTRHEGFCLEPGRHPNSPNQPAFPSAVLRPGETYRHVTVHRFGVQSRP